MRPVCPAAREVPTFDHNGTPHVWYREKRGTNWVLQACPLLWAGGWHVEVQLTPTHAKIVPINDILSPALASLLVQEQQAFVEGEVKPSCTA